MNTIRITLYLMAFAWVLVIGAMALMLTKISSRAAEREREHDLDEEMGEE